MAKIVKKRRKLKIHNLVNIIFVLSIVAYLGSAFVLRSINMSLNYELSQLNSVNQEQQKELETLRIEVTKYTEREYLMAVLSENGIDLTFDSDRITYITEQVSE